MSVKKIITILGELELTNTEQQLFDVNIKMIQSKSFFVKKIGIDGLYSLINAVNFRIGIKRLFTK